MPTFVSDTMIRTHPLHHGGPDRGPQRILEEDIVLCGEETFGMPTSQWAIVHDRDSKGMSHLAKEKGVELGTVTVEQPATSPYLSPIEIV